VAAKRIALVGAGSFSFTRGLVTDLALTADLSGSVAVLHDIDAERLEVMAALARRLVEHVGADLAIEPTLSRQQALTDADFVICTVAIGGVEAWHKDIDIPWRHGIAQSVGDSVGPGGLSRALRVVPLIAEICDDMEALCPQAWLINYSNPLTCNVLAAYQTSTVPTLGLCHGLFGTLGQLEDFLGFDHGALAARAAGVNHLTWILDLHAGGQDVYPLLEERLEAASDVPFPVSARLFRLFGAFPSPGDVHVAEFFPWFLGREAKHGRAYGLSLFQPPTRASEREKTLATWRRQADGQEPLGQMGRSGEKAVDIISAMATGRSEVHVVNIPNQWCLDEMPEGAIVEVEALVGPEGVSGMKALPLPPGVVPWLQARAWQQALTVEAALQGSRQLALQALLADPLVPGLETAEKLLDELLAAHREHLPNFAG